MTGGNWRFAAACLVGLCVAVGAGAKEPGSAKASKQTPWYGRWFGLGGKDKKDAVRVEGDPEKKAAAAVKPPPADPSAALRTRAEADYLRRLAVCNRLMQTAFDTQDEELQRQVEQLEERVWTTYQQQMSRLSTGGAGPLDEEVLDRHLGAAPAAGDRHSSLLSRLKEEDGGQARTGSEEESKR